MNNMTKIAIGLGIYYVGTAIVSMVRIHRMKKLSKAMTETVNNSLKDLDSLSFRNNFLMEDNLEKTDN